MAGRGLRGGRHPAAHGTTRGHGGGPWTKLQPVTPTTPPAIASTRDPDVATRFAELCPAAGGIALSSWNVGARPTGFLLARRALDAIPFTDREPDLGVLAAAGAGDQLDFVIAGGTDFIDWSASYVDDDGNVKQLGSVESSFDPDATGPSPVPLTNATFPAPPAGSQSIVQVFVRFAEGGDASYGWTVTVP